MKSDDAQPGTNSVAGNTGGQPTGGNTKMGPDAQNTLANNPTQGETPAMQPTQPTGEGPKTPASSAAPLADPAAPPAPPLNPAANPADLDLAPANNSGAARPELAPAHPHQPNGYGGNFGNGVEDVYHDANRAANQRSDPNRGEFGQQQFNQGATHGGYGNQYREADYAPNGLGEEKYYGEGSGHPGHQHNAYRAYDGQNLTPAQQGHAVQDTVPPAPLQFDNAAGPAPDGRGNAHDNRNRPDRTDDRAAFQNDNGAPNVGAGFAADYGHSSTSAGLPAGADDNRAAAGPAGRNQQEDGRSSRGGYDNQGSQGGRSRDDQPVAPNQGGAPAPVDAPAAPVSEGYGYGHSRSEQPTQPDRQTGNDRSGLADPNLSTRGGDASQGFGSEGGSYDDQNPGARGPEYDNYTREGRARQNYGDAAREANRPADGDGTDYGPAPRHDEGRD